MEIRLALSANYYRDSYDYEGTTLVSTSHGEISGHWWLKAWANTGP